VILTFKDTSFDGDEGLDLFSGLNECEHEQNQSEISCCRTPRRAQGFRKQTYPCGHLGDCRLDPDFGDPGRVGV